MATDTNAVTGVFTIPQLVQIQTGISTIINYFANVDSVAVTLRALAYDTTTTPATIVSTNAPLITALQTAAPSVNAITANFNAISSWGIATVISPLLTNIPAQATALSTAFSTLVAFADPSPSTNHPTEFTNYINAISSITNTINGIIAAINNAVNALDAYSTFTTNLATTATSNAATYITTMNNFTTSASVYQNTVSFRASLNEATISDIFGVNNAIMLAKLIVLDDATTSTLYNTIMLPTYCKSIIFIYPNLKRFKLIQF